MITSDEYEFLMKATYDDLRHNKVLAANFDDVTQIDIILEGNNYAITSEEKNNKKVWYCQEKELESAITVLSADSFTSEKPNKKEEIRFTV